MMFLGERKMIAWQNLFWEAQVKMADVDFENCGQHSVASSRSVLAFARYCLRVGLLEHHMTALTQAGQDYHVVFEIQVGLC